MTTILFALNTSLVIIILVFAVGICMFFFKHSHHTRIATDGEKLASTIRLIFKEAGRTPISQNRLIRGLKEHFHVNEKVALVLVSRARREAIIKVDGENVELNEA